MTRADAERHALSGIENLRSTVRGAVLEASYEESVPNDRLIAAFGRDKYQRLSLVKSRYDPMNVFCLNQNILPAASS